MNALAEKLTVAGVDTIGARLTAVCTEALRRYPDSIMDAWRHVGIAFGHEFMGGLVDDMRGGRPAVPHKIDPPRAAPIPYRARVIEPERLKKRRELQQIVRSKYQNSAGVAWSDVSWHALSALSRDGNEAVALLAAFSSDVPNDGRTVGDVLGVQRVDEIIAKARAA